MTNPASTPDPAAPDWHLRSTAEALQALQSDAASGLSADEAARRLQQHGANELATQTLRPWWALLLDQFKDFMILVLLAAAIVSGLVGDLIDTLVIVVIVLLNAVIGFSQARRADQAIAALRQLAAAQAQCCGWPVTAGGGQQPGAGRHRAAGGRQPDSGRSASAGGGAAEGGRIDTDRRVGHGREAHRGAHGRETGAGRPREPGLQGHHRHERPRARPGGGHWHAHRTGPGGRPAERHAGPRHAAAAAAGALFKAAVGHRAADQRRAVRHRPAARRAGAGDADDRHQPGGGGDPRGAAGRGHRAAGRRRAAHGRLPRTDPAPAGGGNAGLGQRDLLRQDRHADAEPHARRAGAGGRSGLAADGNRGRADRALAAAPAAAARRRAVQRRLSQRRL